MGIYVGIIEQERQCLDDPRDIVGETNGNISDFDSVETDSENRR